MSSHPALHMVPLPIEPILPELRVALGNNRCVVLSADPGAGKTTRVPLALVDDSWLSGKRIIMLEPRRLAAQRAAAYMALQLGEKAGETVGYRIRGETKVGRKTRIEVVTEGVLTRQLQGDPDLTGVGLVIFDEFHERSIHADLGLALTLDVQEHVRNDLRILVMSATLDGLAISALLRGAPVIKSEGKTYPVVTHHLQREHDGALELLVVSTIMRSLRHEAGDILVFLPGQREIRRVEFQLQAVELPPGLQVHALFGDAPAGKQRAALSPSPSGQRKVILSTSVAETSLTIDGVRVVIDSGLSRVARFDPRRGMSGLVTVPVSRAGADQRRGRAGRHQPGVCYRLWTEDQHGHLARFAQPEIVTADLAPLALELASWGDPEGQGLSFLDPPPAANLSQARVLLTRLGALDEGGKLTSHGQEMSELPVHPRIAHMLIEGKRLGFGSLACDVAALLEERDLLRGESDTDIDLFSRWHVLWEEGARDRFARERARAQAARLRELIGAGNERAHGHKLGLLLALVYPERVAKQREASKARYQLAGGTGAVLPRGSRLARERYLAIGDVDGVGSDVRVYLAAPLREAEIKEAFAGQLTTTDEVRWDVREEAIVARRVTRLGAITLSEASLNPSQDVLRACVIEGIRTLGLEALPWNKDVVSLRARSEWLRARRIVDTQWPDLSDQRLLDTLHQWLGPYLDGVTRRMHLHQLDLSTIIRSLFSFEQLRLLDRLAPTHVTVPTGSRVPLDYTTDPQPVLAVRLQEMFGETETPTVAGGRVRVLLHLLSPAHRPLAVTQDLPSFWKNAYPDVRKDMRGRYPKHSWPENPLEARPTKRVRHR